MSVIVQSKMKQLLPLGLLVFSVNVYAEIWSCTSKSLEFATVFKRIKLESSGKKLNGFLVTKKFSLDTPRMKKLCNSDLFQTLPQYCKDGIEENFYEIYDEREHYIILQKIFHSKYDAIIETFYLHKPLKQITEQHISRVMKPYTYKYKCTVTQ